MTGKLDPHPSHYLDNTTRVMRVLRFLNLLEPGRAVVSVSKMMMWVSFFVLVYVAVFERENLIAVLGAIGAFTGSVGNYAWRRYMGAK